MIKKIKNSNAPVMLVWILGIVVVWEIAAFSVAATKRNPENIIPHIWQILYSFVDQKSVAGGKSCLQLILDNAAITLSRAGIGFLIGVAIGFVLAVLMKASSIVEKICSPYLMLIQMIPILGMAPIILALTHDITISRIVIAAILTFYPVATNTLAGFNSIEREKEDLMHSLAAGKLTRYFKMYIPGSISYFFAGLRIAAPMAITAAILIDTLQGDGGLGCILSQSLKHAMSIYVFWDVVVFSAVFAILSCNVMKWIEYLVSPYKRAELREKRRRV
jgi:NitT/TauT family transport system permease protein